MRAGGAVASPVEAMVRVPRDYRMEVLLGQSWNPSKADSLVLVGLPYVAFVSSTTFTVDSCGNASVDRSFSPVSDTLHDPHGTPLFRSAPVRRAGCWGGGFRCITWRRGMRICSPRRWG